MATRSRCGFLPLSFSAVAVLLGSLTVSAQVRPTADLRPTLVLRNAPAGTAVAIDGVETPADRPPDALNEVFAVNPGRHAVSLRHPAYLPLEFSIDAARGEQVSVTVDLGAPRPVLAQDTIRVPLPDRPVQPVAPTMPTLPVQANLQLQQMRQDKSRLTAGTRMDVLGIISGLVTLGVMFNGARQSCSSGGDPGKCGSYAMGAPFLTAGVALSISRIDNPDEGLQERCVRDYGAPSVNDGAACRRGLSSAIRAAEAEEAETREAFQARYAAWQEEMRQYHESEALGFPEYRRQLAAWDSVAERNRLAETAAADYRKLVEDWMRNTPGTRKPPVIEVSRK